MSTRSIDRDLHLSSNLVRSQSIDHEYLLNQALYVPSSAELRHTRDSLILDLQAQMAELNKECIGLQRELDSNKDKLSSSMNSIKTFWSPELKKERALRKEESSKLSQLQENYKIIQAQNTVRFI
jgi:ELKS/RAB6-interacting/CAST family protein 1